MRILLTGGAGFIGAHVAERLAEDGHNLLLPVRKAEAGSAPVSGKGEISRISCDLAKIHEKAGVFLDFQPETAIHMAWEGIPDYSAGMSTRNLRYGLDLMTMLAEMGCPRVIYTGSCWEYQHKSGCLAEDAPVHAANPFTVAKISLFQMGREIAKENGMAFIWTRPFYVFGPGQKLTSLVPHIIDCVLKGEPPGIKTPGARNDFVYAGDVAGAVSSIVEHCFDSVVLNIGAGVSHSVREITQHVYDILDQDYPSDILNAKDPVPPVDFWADISRIREHTGWEPGTPSREGIRETVRYVQSLDQRRET